MVSLPFLLLPRTPSSSLTAHAQDQDPDENVYPAVLSEAEVEDAIRNGTIFDSKTLSAWLCWKLS